jgi:hypothetical protein
MFELLLGHLVGDYLLQNEWMAMNKSKNTWEGWLACTIHCILYSFAVCLLMWNFDPIWFVAVFLSHFPIDKFRLAEHYMHYIKGKGMRDYVLKDTEYFEIKYGAKPTKNLPLNRYDVLEGGFTSLVYSVTDNTMHLLLMWGAYNLIY